MSPSASDTDSDSLSGNDPAESSMMDFLPPGPCSDSDCTPSRPLSPYFTDSESDRKPDFVLTDLWKGQEVQIITDEKVDTLVHRISPPLRRSGLQDRINRPHITTTSDCHALPMCQNLGRGATETNPI